MAKLITKGNFRVTHDHVARQTKLMLIVGDQVVRSWPWCDGVLTCRKAQEANKVKAKDSEIKPAKTPRVKKTA